MNMKKYPLPLLILSMVFFFAFLTFPQKDKRYSVGQTISVGKWIFKSLI